MSTIKNIHGYDIVFDNIHISFSTSLSIFKNSCETLLSPLIPLDNVLHELLEKNDATAWENAELGKSLRGRLGQSYDPYMASVKLVKKKIALFGKKLRLNDDMKVSIQLTFRCFDLGEHTDFKLNYKPPWIKDDCSVDIKLRAKFFKNRWTCIKGGFESKKYAILLNEIDADIRKIALLTEGVIRLEPIRLEKKRRAERTHSWIGIRNHARRLFETFHSRWSCSCSCSCQYPHRASLRLDMRKDSELAQIGPRFIFNLSFDSDAAETVTAAAAALPWHRQDVEIKPFSISSNT